jgi:hypothetical protein
VRTLLFGMLVAGHRRRRLGRIGQRDDRMAVFAGVCGQLLTAELAAFPPAVEGMLEDVPALPGGVEAIDQLHGDPSVEG